MLIFLSLVCIVSQPVHMNFTDSPSESISLTQTTSPSESHSPSVSMSPSLTVSPSLYYVLVNTRTPANTPRPANTPTPTHLPTPGAQPQSQEDPSPGGISGGLAAAGIVFFFLYLYYSGPSADSCTRTPVTGKPTLSSTEGTWQGGNASTSEVVTTNVMYKR